MARVKTSAPAVKPPILSLSAIRRLQPLLGSCQIAESLIEEPISPKMPASVYKSNPPGRKTGFPEKWLPKLRFPLQVSDTPTIRPSDEMVV